MSQTKWCSRCDKTLPTTEFWRDLSRRDDLDHWCKQCRHDSARARYDAKKKRERRALYPIKNKARQMINNGVANGTIAKESCFLCGEIRTDAHHLNYDYPLKVVWLCKKHHGEVHNV